MKDLSGGNLRQRNQPSNRSRTDASNGVSQGKPNTQSGGIMSCCCWCIVKFLFWVLFILFLFLFFIAPLIIKLYPDFPRQIVYLNAFKIPFGVNLSDPNSTDLTFTENFYLTTDQPRNITIGVWHVLPRSLQTADNENKITYKSLLKSNHKIFLYCHGNTGHRGTDHRVMLYQLLSRQDYHVFALDYRGYGDSSGSPTSENGVVSDVISLYKYILEINPNADIYIWGHSLGTGIAMKASRRLMNDEITPAPRGVFLESPFNNIYEAAVNHPFAKLIHKLWWFDHLFLKGMSDHGIYLQSDEHIQEVNLPILIFHAEDDFVVPYALGLKLYEASKKRPDHFKPVTFHSFQSERNFKHKWICTAHELPQLIKDFVDINK